MSREISQARAWINALFVLGVAGLSGFGIREISARRWGVQPTFSVRAEFPTVSGINVGDRVRVQGIDAGVVEAIVPPRLPGGSVTVAMRVDETLRHLVRSDALARIAMQGVVGAKVVEIRPGKPDAPELIEGASLAVETTPEPADLIRDATLSLKRIDAAATAAEKGLDEIRALAASIRDGKGSLGKLIQDDEVHRNLAALAVRGNKVLDDLGEGIDAVKHTWPVSRYFNERAYYDRERVLYQPGADRQGKTLISDQIFEPGRAVLTRGGRDQLDGVAAWFKKVKASKTEVVIAAFTDESSDPDLAQVLTQEQAEAVRSYLSSRHSIDSVGLFGTRKVAAVGFGSHTPRSATAMIGADVRSPARRVEIILFTPRA